MKKTIPLSLTYLCLIANVPTGLIACENGTGTKEVTDGIAGDSVTMRAGETFNTAGGDASNGGHSELRGGHMMSGEEAFVAGETYPDGLMDAAGNIMSEDAEPECNTQCAFRWCGDDGCGGVCGPCGEDLSCVEGPWPDLPISGYTCQPSSYPSHQESELCPPNPNAIGKEVGDVIPDVGLVRCEDQFPTNHRGMCAHKVTITYQINVDCAPCITYVNQVLAQLNEEFADQGLQIYVIFDKAEECEDLNFFSPRTAGIEYLIDIRHGVSFIFGTGGRGSTLVMTEGNVIVSYDKGPLGDGPDYEVLREQILEALNPQ